MGSESKKICPQCGEILSADARFCPKCGQMVEEEIKINEQLQPTKKCSQCGAFTNENAKFCASCGAPVVYDRGISNNGNFQNASQRNEDKSSNSQKIVYEKNNGFWTTGRLVFGIFSILIFVFMVFQSCVVGTINTFSYSGEISGTQGMLTAIMYLSAGITGIASRNSRSKGGPLASAILYWIGALFTAGGSDIYGDLMIWGVLAACLGLFFMYCAIRTDGGLKEKKRIIWLIISAMITAMLIAMSTSGGDKVTEEDTVKANEYDLMSGENKEKEIVQESIEEATVETTTEPFENEAEALLQGTYIYDDGSSIYSTAEVIEDTYGLRIDIDAMGYGGHQQGFANGYLNGLGGGTYSCIAENDSGTFILKITDDGFDIIAHPASGMENMFVNIEGHYVYHGFGNAKADGYYEEDRGSKSIELVGVNEPHTMILDSSKRLITDADVSGMTSEQLRIAVNEIYARHGRRFADTELQDWFNSQAWYQGTVSPENFNENVLSQVEKDNIKFLQQKRDGKPVSAERELGGKYEVSFGSDGGAELEIVYGSGDDIYTVGFYGSYLNYAGGTKGFLVAYADNVWDYYENGGYSASMRLNYDGFDTIIVTSLDGVTLGGMGFSGFSGTYSRTAEYDRP